MMKYWITGSLLTIMLFTVNGQTGFPCPPRTDNMLFFLQRSHNRNTVIYELNVLENGKLKKNRPVHLYWIKYEEEGIREELSFIQNMAYGISSKLTDEKRECYTLHFNRFNDKEIILMTNNSGKYRAYMQINHQLAELERVFISAEGYSNGKPLKIHFIEFQGTSMENNLRITERIIP